MWDERYAVDEYAYGKQPNDFLSANYKLIPKGRVLCLAEGEGRNAVFLAQQGYAVTGVDASIEGVKKSQRLAEENHVEVEFIHSDLAHFDIGRGKWDGIVSISCHLPSHLRKKVHADVQEGLKSGGVLILEAYTPRQLELATGGPKDADFCMTSEALRTELPDLGVLHDEELEREVVEGIYHHGLGAVVQFIARKTPEGV